MKTIKEIGKASLIALAVLLSPSTVYADDTEIFFSRAKADNDENQPIANVFIMLDTSGSMRFCENSLSVSGYNATWCSNVAERRINILQDALKDMLNDLPEGVRIGIGRFNYNISNIYSNSGGTGQIGGRVLVPVTDIDEASRKIFLSEIEKLNDAGDDASGPYPGAQPVGDTPTGRAYAEAARYMMGLVPVYGTAGNGAQSSICVEEATREVGCRQVFDSWKDYEVVAFCDVLDPSCKVEYGDEWRPAPGGCDTSSEACMADYGPWTPIAGTCNVSNTDTCRRDIGGWGPDTNVACDISQPDCRLGGWDDWVVTRASGANGSNCRTNQNTDFFERRRVNVCTSYYWWGGCRSEATQCQERTRLYQTRTSGYSVREVTYFERDEIYFQREAVYREECDIETYCAEEAPIISGGRYVSPMNMENQCESNHVILFTDGQPSSNDSPGNQGFTNCGSKGSYDCQVQISSYLYNENNAKKREVKTYNIGLYMGNAEANMRRVSTDGADGTINADDSDALVKAFSDIVNLIADNSRSFSAPGVAVNQMNRLEHLDQLYYAVFEPRKSSYWQGNLKRYRVANDQIRAANGPAVDPETGFFAEGSRSFWSSEVDGADVRKGGAREQVAGRKLYYTDAVGTMRLLDWKNDNNPALFGLPASADQDDVTAVKDQLRIMWGDPLHSEPVLVNYGGDSENNVIFVSGNDGMLHAIDSRDGTEKFSFMPYDMIRKANLFTTERPGLALDNTRQIYGLDGSWTAWRKSGMTASSAPSKVYLYGGMRRGGYSYYALDVTTMAPKRLWQISRGQPGFERLGQTWSQPTLAQVKVGGAKVPVLVFGGGYSPADHDRKEGTSRGSGDAMGNAIYVVDALTGNLLWSAGADGSSSKHTDVASMKWSIPSNISVVDTDFDGAADFFYFADMGGQIFRADLDQDDVTDSKVRRLANLSGTGASNNRRFYYAPAISYVKNEETGQENLFISIGSGYRAHPLDVAVDDHFFVIRDDGVARDATNKFRGSEPTALITMNSLDTLSGSGPADTDKPGWKLPFPGAGEKGLSSPVVFGNRIFFTTYQPGGDQEADNPCVVRIGTSFLYVVDLVTGQAASLNNDGEVSGDRGKELRQDVPPPSPTLLSDGEKVLIIVGTEVAGGDDLGDTGFRRGSWFQLAPDEEDRVPLPSGPKP